MMKKYSFNLDERVNARLEEIAEAEGLNKTAMLTTLINAEYKKNILMKEEQHQLEE